MSDKPIQTPSAIIEKANVALRDLFGFSALRPHQEPIIEAVFRNENLLVVMPTGAGKSMIFQLPAFARRGLTLVVSPLIALMKDQVDQLTQKGLGNHVASINSTQSFEEQLATLDRVRDQDADDAIRLLYVSPERFQSRAFLDALSTVPLRMLAIDEAHCISQWGHDFRPDYTRLNRAIEQFEPRQVIALTATATTLVQEDIITQLGIDLHVMVAGFKRENLFFEVRPASRKADKVRVIESLMREMGPFGIVYCATRKNVEHVAESLRNAGLNVAEYHGGMDDEWRHAEQERFAGGRADIIVATNAFGMGVDKPDVRFIAHYDIPGSIEAYYQEAGRAGRDGKPSRCTLLFSPHDLRVQELFLDGENPTPQAIREVWAKLLAVPGDVIEQTRAEMAEGLTHVTSESAVSTIIKLLERHDYVKRLFDHQAKAALRLIGTTKPRRGTAKANLYEFLAAEPKSRTSGVSFDFDELAEQLGIAPETLRSAIRSLEDARVVHYQPPFRGRAVQIKRRCEPEDLDLDWDALDEKRKSARSKLDQMVQYAEFEICRHRALLTYFGEDIDDCGDSCDVCKMAGASKIGGRQPGGKPGSVASAGMQFPLKLSDGAKDAVFTILRLAKKLRGTFGSRRITQILTGSRDQQILQWKLDRYEEHGQFEHLTQDVVNNAVDALISAGILELYKKNPEDNFKRCRLTDRGEEVLARKIDELIPSKIEIALLDTATVTATGTAAGDPDPPGVALRGGPPPTVPHGFDSELYAKLRDWRTDTAARDSVPLYVVCNNQTLQTIAAAKPTTAPALEAVKGMGPIKVEKYGAEMIRLIRDHLGDSATLSPLSAADTPRKDDDATAGSEDIRYDSRRSNDSSSKPRPKPRRRDNPPTTNSDASAPTADKADNPGNPGEIDTLLDHIFADTHVADRLATASPPHPEAPTASPPVAADDATPAPDGPERSFYGSPADADRGVDFALSSASRASGGNADYEPLPPIRDEEMQQTFHMLFFGRTPAEIARVHSWPIETVLRHIEELIHRNYDISPAQLFDPALPTTIRDTFGAAIPPLSVLTQTFPDTPSEQLRLALAWLRAAT